MIQSDYVCPRFVAVGLDSSFFYLFISLYSQFVQFGHLVEFLTVILTCWWLPPPGYHPRVC